MDNPRVIRSRPASIILDEGAKPFVRPSLKTQKLMAHNKKRTAAKPLVRRRKV